MTENEDSMYKNLGDLLNQVLNKGTIPHINCNNEEQNQKENNNQLKKDQNTKQNEQNQANSQNNKTENGKITKNQTPINKKSIRFFKKKEKQPSTVIKMHKHTENIQFSPEITNALTTLDIAYPFTINQLKRRYRELCKLYHPDKNTIKNNKITIQKSQNVYKSIQLDINNITESYKLLLKYFF